MLQAVTDPIEAPAGAEAGDALERALSEFLPANQIVLGLVLGVVGIAAIRFVVARLSVLAPPPEIGPPPPPLSALPPNWPPLTRRLAHFALKFGFGPPRSMTPVLLPLTFVVWLIVQRLATEFVGIGTLSADGNLDATPLAAIGRAQLLTAGAMLLFFVCWTRRFGGGLRDLGLDRRGLVGVLLFAAAYYGAFLPVQLGAIAIENGARGLLGQPLDGQAMVAAFVNQPAVQRDAIVWLGLAVAAPLHEELIFRGVLLRFLGRVLPMAVAVAANGLLFAALHDGGRLTVFTLGVGLAWLMRRTGNLAAPLLFHMMHNGLTLAALAAS